MKKLLLVLLLLTASMVGCSQPSPKDKKVETSVPFPDTSYQHFEASKTIRMDTSGLNPAEVRYDTISMRLTKVGTRLVQFDARIKNSKIAMLIEVDNFMGSRELPQNQGAMYFLCTDPGTKERLQLAILVDRTTGSVNSIGLFDGINIVVFVIKEPLPEGDL